MSARVDLCDRTFGRLTVQRIFARTRNGSVIWRCLCQCGSYVDVPAYRLTRGQTRSCGCLAREEAAANMERRRGLRGRLT
jgi:hypothetical protein